MSEIISSNTDEVSNKQNKQKNDDVTKKGEDKSSKKTDNKKETDRLSPAEYDWNSLSEKEKTNIKKYGNPRKLGFLRFIMICCGIQPIFVLLATQVIVNSAIIVDVALIHAVLDAMLYTVIFALIWMRKKAIKQVGILTVCIDLILTIVDYFVKVGFDPTALQVSDLVQGVVLNALMIVYFATSRRVKYACTRPLHTSDHVVEVKDSALISWKTWPFWRDLIIIFVVFGVVGHWMEFGYCTLIKLGLIPGEIDPANDVWHNLMKPFPIYGGGAVACVIMFNPLKIRLQKAIKSKAVVLILIFVISGVVCSLMELILGFAINGDLSKWNYSRMFCNFMGQVCLQNSLGFALAATIMTYLVYPLLKQLFAKFQKYMNIVFVAVVVLGILLYAFYYFDFLPKMIKQYAPDLYNEKFSLSEFN